MTIRPREQTLRVFEVPIGTQAPIAISDQGFEMAAANFAVHGFSDILFLFFLPEPLRFFFPLLLITLIMVVFLFLFLFCLLEGFLLFVLMFLLLTNYLNSTV